ncbi:MAG: iron chaperone [Candidatus Sulfotelmatobacter sp.]
MKKAKSRKDRSGGNRKVVPKNVDEYLARVPEPARSALGEIRAAIRSAVPPEATETISYRIPAFRYKEVLVWFAAFSDHCSLFPSASVIEAFKKELAGFYTSKGTIQFPTNEPLPVALIKRLVKARVAHVEGNKRH